MNEARSTLDKWVETKHLISKTRSDWQSDKEMLEQTAQLYERELRNLEEQMSKISTNNAQVEKERLEAEGLKKSAGEALDKAREFAVGFEGKLQKLNPLLPEPLQEIIKPLLQRIPTDPNTRMTSAERMQVVVGILNELDKFDSSVAVFNEKRKNPKGDEVSVQTLYLGLGIAYFVNDAADFAGVGSPGTGGWEWSAKPEIADSVKEAIRIYRNERPARFISLPAIIR